MKLALVQLNPTMGDFEGNLQRFIARAALAPRDALLVGPELALSGYQVQDLILRDDFLPEQDRVIDALNAWLLGQDRRAIIGRVARNLRPNGYAFENQAVLLDGHTVTVLAVKRLLPCYDVFGEPRYFEPGEASTVTVLSGARIGVAVCEDGWNNPKEIYPEDPVEDLAGQDLDFFLFINASPSNYNKAAGRKARFGAIAQRYGKPFISVNQTGATDDLVFDGASFMAGPNGEWTQAPLFAEGVFLVDSNGGEGTWVGDEGIAHGAGMDDRDAGWTAFTHAQLVMGIRDYVRKNGAQRIAIALSGGADSSLVLALAVDAIGAANVTAVTMPSRFSSDGSVSDSEVLANLLGVKLYHRAIADDVDTAVAAFTKAFDQEPARLTLENLQARVRGVAIMAWANQTNALVLSTGNKSESAMGYCTLYGDTNGALNPIGDLYKSEVYRLLQFYADQGRMPQSVIDKAPSAELFPGQVDQDSLPPYTTVLDPFLQLYLEHASLTPAQRNARRAMLSDAGFTAEQGLALLRRVEGAEFKRQQSCPVVRLRTNTFGTGRNIPIARSSFLSLRTAERLLALET